MRTNGNGGLERRSGFAEGENSAPIHEFSDSSLGQSYPQHYPQVKDALGEPLSILEVARLLGCSDWTVRHRYLPQGIPHFRPGPGGKLVFFRNQVVAWILHQQKQKGGK
jgi:hypothetical protein